LPTGLDSREVNRNLERSILPWSPCCPEIYVGYVGRLREGASEPLSIIRDQRSRLVLVKARLANLMLMASPTVVLLCDRVMWRRAAARGALWVGRGPAARTVFTYPAPRKLTDIMKVPIVRKEEPAKIEVSRAPALL
jgi:hypothetical protein